MKTKKFLSMLAAVTITVNALAVNAGVLSGNTCWTVKAEGMNGSVIDFTGFETNTNFTNAVLNNMCWTSADKTAHINDFFAVGGKFGKMADDTSVYIKKNPGTYEATDADGNGQAYFPFLNTTFNSERIGEGGQIVLSMQFAFQNSNSSLFMSPFVWNDNSDSTQSQGIEIKNGKAYITMGGDTVEAACNTGSGMWHRLDIVYTAGQASNSSIKLSEAENPNRLSLYIDGKRIINNIAYNGQINQNQYAQICGIKNMRVGFKEGSANTAQTFPDIGTYLDDISAMTYKNGNAAISEFVMPEIQSGATVSDFKQMFDDCTVKIVNAYGEEITDNEAYVYGNYAQITESGSGRTFYIKPYSSAASVVGKTIDFNSFETNKSLTDAVINNQCWQDETMTAYINDFLSVNGQFGKSAADKSVYIKKNSRMSGKYPATDVKGNGQAYFPFLNTTFNSERIGEGGQIVLSMQFAFQNSDSSLFMSPFVWNDNSDSTQSQGIEIKNGKVYITMGGDTVEEACNTGSGMWHRLDIVYTAGQASNSSIKLSEAENPNRLSLYIDGKRIVNNIAYNGQINQNRYAQICGIKNMRVGFKEGSANTEQNFPNVGTYLDDISVEVYKNGDAYLEDITISVPYAETVQELKKAMPQYELNVYDEDGNSVADSKSPVGKYVELTDIVSGRTYFVRPYVNRCMTDVDFNDEIIYSGKYPSSFTQNGLGANTTVSSVNGLDGREDNALLITMPASKTDQNLQIFTNNQAASDYVVISDGEKYIIEFDMYIADFNSARTVFTQGSDGGMVTFLNIEANGVIKSEKAVLGKINTLGWYHFAAEFTGNSSVYNLYMNGRKIGSEINVINDKNVTSGGKLRFILSKSNAEKETITALDDIKMYTADYYLPKEQIETEGITVNQNKIILSEANDNILDEITTNAAKTMKDEKTVMLRSGKVYEYINIIDRYISKSADGEKTAVSVTESNDTSGSISRTVIAAVYDENGKLCDISAKTKILDEYSFATITAEVTAGEGYTVKGFMVDNAENIMPLINAN